MLCLDDNVSSLVSSATVPIHVMMACTCNFNIASVYNRDLFLMHSLDTGSFPSLSSTQNSINATETATSNGDGSAVQLNNILYIMILVAVVVGFAMVIFIVVVCLVIMLKAVRRKQR